MIDPTWISLTSAFTALIASVVGPTVTLRVARQQFRTSVVSVNRQKWIEMLRDAIADAVSQLQAAASVRHAQPLPDFASIGSDPAILARVEALTRTLAKVELLLNPLEDDHQDLLRIMREATALLRKSVVDADLGERIDQAVVDILRGTQKILKREWVRVKTGQ